MDSSDIIDQQAKQIGVAILKGFPESDGFLPEERTAILKVAEIAFKAGARRKITSAEIEEAAFAMYLRWTVENELQARQKFQLCKDTWIALLEAALRSIGHSVE